MGNLGKIEEQRDVPKDAPIRLSVAALLAYPDGSMTVSGLRREAARGRLIIERVAGKDYTTLGAIEEMRELCRVRVKEPTSGCARSAAELESSSERRRGSSSTKVSISPRDALRLKLQKQKPALRPISPANTGLREENETSR